MTSPGEIFMEMERQAAIKAMEAVEAGIRESQARAAAEEAAERASR